MCIVTGYQALRGVVLTLTCISAPLNDYVMAMAADDRPRMSRVHSFRISQQITTTTTTAAPTSDQLEQLLKYLGEVRTRTHTHTHTRTLR